MRFRFAFQDVVTVRGSYVTHRGYYEGGLKSTPIFIDNGAIQFNNSYHGKGAKKYKNGIRLEGHFDDGIFQNGVLTLPNKETHQGKWTELSEIL